MKYKVLIVDDEVNNLEFMNRTLRRNWDVTMCDDPITALEILPRA